MQKWIKKRFTNDPKAWAKFFAVALFGAGLGYLYYNYFGCNGTCPMTNNSNITIGIGAFLGANFGIDFIMNKKDKD
jgi:hypothetical protein